MRLIKIFGLAAVAAVAAMAFVGASSAMAGSTQLCTNDVGVCTEPGTVHFVDKTALLATLTPKLHIVCEALLQGTVTKGLVTNGPVPIAVAAHTGLVYTNCNNGCTALTTEGGTILVLRTAKELAVVTADAFQVNLKCGAAVNCFYNAVGLSGHGLGPLLRAEEAGAEDTHVTYKEAVVNKVKGLCPTSALLTALFVSLQDIFIRE